MRDVRKYREFVKIEDEDLKKPISPDRWWNFFSNKCKCNHKNTIKDDYSGESICKDCGEILNEK